MFNMYKNYLDQNLFRQKLSESKGRAEMGKNKGKDNTFFSILNYLVNQ